MRFIYLFIFALFVGGIYSGNTFSQDAKSTADTSAVHKKKKASVPKHAAKPVAKPAAPADSAMMAKPAKPAKAPKAPKAPDNRVAKGEVKADDTTAVQKKEFASEIKKHKTDISIIQTEPEFPGGEARLMGFLDQNLQYPQEAASKRIKGTIVVSFLVDKKGKINNPTVINGDNDQFKAEALRVVGIMPDWIPAKAGGSPVDAQYILKIDFGGKD